ncbi:MAG: thiamine pyrophosphate-dependent enzyme [Nocardioides sp.]
MTAIRLVMSTSHALGSERRRGEMGELDGLLAGLEDKLAELGVGPEVADRRERIQDALRILERRLYELESGPTGRGSSATVIANATGCSSVYASTMPYNPYNDPWVNSLFQDAQPLAKGMFEGLAARAVDDVRALRTAQLELADAYDPAVHDEELRLLTWGAFSPDEMKRLPTVLTIGGDGATYDIGFGALSRVLASETAIKVMVLNTGVYSNTGGQASTSSFTGQDSDLSRFGHAHTGKHETRKELGLIASFHPNVFVCATSTALQGHFLKNTLEFLTYGDAPAVMDVYTPCGSEHGIADDASAQRARLAVESRMNPVFVHDPRRGSTLHEWFSLEGNPDPDKTWTTMSVEHLDGDGNLQLFDTPMTPADFALGEVRFKKHFRKLRPDEDATAVPIDAFVDLSAGERREHVPFVWATDADKHLIKVFASPTIVALVEDRRRYWQMLQFLAGVHLAKLTALHQHDIDALQARYDEAQQARETSLDQIADAMAELATSSKAQPAAFGGLGIGAAPGVAGAAAPAAESASSPAAGTALVVLSEEDQLLCNDCKTCYQDLPSLFEKTKIVVHGEASTPG